MQVVGNKQHTYIHTSLYKFITFTPQYEVTTIHNNNNNNDNNKITLCL